MVAYKNRVRGHSYINGFGDGGVKVVDNNSGLRGDPNNKDTKKFETSVNTLDNNVTNANGSGIASISGNRETFLHDRAQQQRQKQLMFLRQHPKTKVEISKQNWEMYFPNQQQQEQQQSKTIGTGSNGVYLDHHYRNPIPQVADMWYFTTYIIIVASFILCGSILLNLFSIPKYTSTASSVVSDTKKSSSAINAVPAGGGVGVNGVSSNTTKSKYKKFKEKPVVSKLKTDEYNEDYDEDQYERYGHSISTDVQREVFGGEIASGPNALSTNDVVLLEGSPDVNSVYYPYHPLQNHHQHRHRKSATSSSIAAISTAAIAGTSTASNSTCIVSGNRDHSANPVTPLVTDTSQGDSLMPIQDGGNTAFTNSETEGSLHPRAGVYYLNHSGNIVIANKKHNNQFQSNGTPPLVSSAQININAHQGLMMPEQLTTPSYDRQLILDQSCPGNQTPSLIHRNGSNDYKSPHRSNPTLDLQLFDSHQHENSYTSNLSTTRSMLHARPLPTTASSFVSLTGHSADSLQSFDESFSGDDINACSTPQSTWMGKYNDYGNDEDFYRNPNYDENNDMKAPLLQPRSTQVRHRRREDTTSASSTAITGIADSNVSAARSRMLSPASDDIRYLLGIDSIDHAEEVGLQRQVNGGSNHKTQNTNSNRSEIVNSVGNDQRTPQNDRVTHRRPLHMQEPQENKFNNSAIDLLEKTPRVTNGRQSIVFEDFMAPNDEKVHDLGDESRDCVSNQGQRRHPTNEGTRLPTLHHENQRLRDREQIYADPSQSVNKQHLAPIEMSPKNRGNLVKKQSRSDSESSFSGGLLDHGMCYQFASPPNAHRRLLTPDTKNGHFVTSSKDTAVAAIPFVPNLYGASRHPRKAPPKSVNIDDFHLYQLMETGNISHWEARVAEESRILQDQHNAVGKQQTPDSAGLFNSSSVPIFEIRKDHNNFDDSTFSLHMDEMSRRDSNAGNIRDQVMAVASDAMKSCESIPSGDPRKSIVHIRPDLTDDTDASTALQGSIDFEDLRLVEIVGGGGFGQVWKAVWLGTPVAVKVLTGSAQAKNVPKIVLQEFAAEINLLKGMRHPNICLYMGACIAPPNRAIITEFAANGSLWDALRLPLMPPYTPCDGLSREGWPDVLYQPDSRHGAPPVLSTPVRLTIVPRRGTWHWILVKHVARGAARGMAYLHSGNPPVLHRDLKSANILLDESYTAKVCDFGLSRLKAQESNMTGNCGTVQWMAPEVLSNENYNEKADVYSYGIICWELLTAECPFEGMAPIQCALAVLNRDQRPEIPKWCPPALQALIRSCVKKDPKLRPTFEQIIEKFDTMP